MKCTALQIFSFQMACLVSFILTGCNKVADTKMVKDIEEGRNKIHKDTFSYEINIYNTKGRLSVYKLSSLKPITQLDSNIFMEESLKAERQISNP